MRKFHYEKTNKNSDMKFTIFLAILIMGIYFNLSAQYRDTISYDTIVKSDVLTIHNKTQNSLSKDSPTTKSSHDPTLFITLGTSLAVGSLACAVYALSCSAQSANQINNPAAADKFKRQGDTFIKISAVLIIPSIILLRQGFRSSASRIKPSNDLKKNKADIDNLYFSFGSSGFEMGVQIRF